MNGFFRYMAEINVVIWILGLFLFHGFLYFLLGTPNWLGVTSLAAGTWALALVVLKAIGRAMLKEEVK